MQHTWLRQGVQLLLQGLQVLGQTLQLLPRDAGLLRAACCALAAGPSRRQLRLLRGLQDRQPARASLAAPGLGRTLWQHSRVACRFCCSATCMSRRYV